MGMAASQARFLGLTARKNNVEFEGQQINQQRTALSNKSASYYTDLLGMSVPTPPAVEDFTQTVYSFNDGALTNQITSLIAADNGTYTMAYIKSWKDDFSIVSATPSIITKTDDGYKIGATDLFTLGDATGRDDDPYYKSLSTDQREKLIEEEDAYLALLQKDYGDDTEYYVRYIQNTSTGEYEPRFYNQDDVEGETTVYDDKGNSLSYIPAYTIGSKDRVEEIKGITGCYIEQDSTGRYINISIPDSAGNLKTHALTTNTVTDNDAYNDAMNQYEFDKAQYERTIQEINAKIEIVQAEDKDLELRLKQLDTEHNAISNEKDAVEKVIQKNVESSFKTFG